MSGCGKTAPELVEGAFFVGSAGVGRPRPRPIGQQNVCAGDEDLAPPVLCSRTRKRGSGGVLVPRPMGKKRRTDPHQLDLSIQGARASDAAPQPDGPSSTPAAADDAARQDQDAEDKAGSKARPTPAESPHEIIAEAVSATPSHSPFDPKRIVLPFHRRVDTSFLEYASYVIRDRAIPAVADGLKPVQRRILWAMHQTDDGRFTKVANVIGDTTKYHPHGDASIGDALVVLANKRYLIERQGNYGNLYTGDPAAAPRYIECRLTELARTELFNDELTAFVPSYDGRKQEPVALPSKLPLTLMLGAEGIAVGLSARILPHNFSRAAPRPGRHPQGAALQMPPRLPDRRSDGRARIRGRQRRRQGPRPAPGQGRIDHRHQGDPARNHDRIAHRLDRERRSQGQTQGQIGPRLHLRRRRDRDQGPRGGGSDKLADALYAFTDCEVRDHKPDRRHQRPSPGRDDGLRHAARGHGPALPPAPARTRGNRPSSKTNSTSAPSNGFLSRSASTRSSSARPTRRWWPPSTTVSNRSARNACAPSPTLTSNGCWPCASDAFRSSTSTGTARRWRP